jgi:Sulfotransferase family
MTTSRNTKVLYIGGYSRSGSTLLLRLLGELPGFVAVGELFDIWQRSYIENQLCGCGTGFRQCEFWTRVTAEAFGCTPEDVPARRLTALRSAVQGHTHLPALCTPQLRSHRYRRRLRTYADILSRLYDAIRAVAGSDVIIDSSKVPQYAQILAEANGIELHMVHLVRDSRASAYSWQRQRVRPEITDRRAYMDRHSVLRSGSEWTVFNSLLRSGARRYQSYTLIRYEDLVTNWNGELRRLAGALGTKLPQLDEANDPVVTLRSSHTASGNPSRFQSGKIRIAPDTEWMKAMRASARLLVTGLTAPGLVRYHYPLLLPRTSEDVRCSGDV